MRRAAVAAVVLVGTAGLGACADDAPQAAPTVMTVTARHCSTPTLGRGVATAIDDDLVVTAGHLVEGAVRDVEVAGHPAAVVALDRRSDLALVAVDLPDDAVPAELAADVPDEGLMVTPDAETAVDIDRRVIQVVEHATDRATYRRDVVVFAPAVARGTSGAPLLDASGRLAGVVVATFGTEAADSETYAVTSAEVQALLDAHDGGSSPAPDGGCAGSERSPA